MSAVARSLGTLLGLPDFVLRAPTGAAGFGVPILIFHWLAPEELDAHLCWLRDAGYETLGAADVARIAHGEMLPPGRAAVLTFDDGLYNNWSVVAPLLRRHGMRGIAFLVPRLLGSSGLRPTIDDIVAGRAERGQVVDHPLAESYLTWDEAAALAGEGVLEVQSHSFDHAQVFTSDEVVDFQHPLPDGRPRYRWLWSAAGAEPGDPLWGAPVYPMAPRLVARRYVDDPGLRDACRRFVAVRGERGFFADVTWRTELTRFARLERRRRGSPGRMESAGEAEEAQLRTLARGREALRERIGREVDQVALPWSRASESTARLIRASGHRVGYTCERPSQRLGAGSDPFDLGRVEGYWLRSLPGPRRVGLAHRLERRLRRRLGGAAAALTPW